MLIWDLRGGNAVCKVALAGDFLPAGCTRTADVRNLSDAAEQVLPLFEDSDVAFLNLESTLDVADLIPSPSAGLGSSLHAPPDILRYLSCLRTVPVAIANNHIFDFGIEGLNRTRSALLARGMVPLGAGHKTSEPPPVHVWQSPSGVRIGFWASAIVSSRTASHNSIGTEPATLQRAQFAISELHRLGATCCIALVHAGLERTNHPDPTDVSLLDSIAKTGFSIVAASHSHRISGSKLIFKGDSSSVCFYGLGSISSGIRYGPLECEGLVVVLGISREGTLVSVAVNPVFITETGWGAQPEPSTRRMILERFRDLSICIGDDSYRKMFYRDIGQGLFTRQMKDVAAAFRNCGVQGVLKKLGRTRLRHVRQALRAVIN